VIQEVERRNSQVQVAAFAHAESFLECEIGIDEFRSVCIWKDILPVRAHSRQSEAGAVKVLVLCQPLGGVTGQHWLQAHVGRAQDRLIADVECVRPLVDGTLQVEVWREADTRLHVAAALQIRDPGDQPINRPERILPSW
jgi:hypothetical protein